MAPSAALTNGVVDPKAEKWELLAFKSKSRPLFAWRVFGTLFADREMVGRNVRGISFGDVRKGKLNEAKMNLVRMIVEKWKPLKYGEKWYDCWRACEKGIDSNLRKKKFDV